LFHSKGLVWIAPATLGFLLLLIIAHNFDSNSPYLPNGDEAGDYVLDRYDEPIGAAFSTIQNSRISQIQTLGKTRVVVSRYTQGSIGGDSPTMDLYFIDFITKFPVTGLVSLNTIGGSLPDHSRGEFSLVSSYQADHYVVGGASNNEGIHFVELRWIDGTTSRVPAVDGTFLAFALKSTQLERVVGLNEQGTVLNDTLTYNRQLQFSPLNYSAIREIITEGGLIVMGAFSSDIPLRQECIELTYLTGENLTKYFNGNGALNGQRLCLEPGNKVITPAIVTNVDGQTVAGGRVLDETIERVRINWSDGLQQTESVVNGFYFVQRPGTSSTIVSVTDSD